MTKHIGDLVVAITGTSCGIGKATALAFAGLGSRLALCARREKQLAETAEECRNAGADVLSLTVDVSDQAQVQALAAQAIERFGRIDVWINNAAVDCFGAFGDIPTEAFDRVIQINLLGTANGARAVLPHFRDRRAGVMINNASMVGTCPTPFHSAYVASKFAIRGLSFSLREELVDIPDIHVCVISPASIDTPLWQRSANFSGRKVKALDPVYPPEQVAAIMVDLARSPRREVFAGAVAWMSAEQHAAAPELTESMYAAFTRGSLFRDEPAKPSPGVLFDAAKDGHADASGGWLSPDRPALPASDVFSLGAGPALLAMAPSLYAWKLSHEFLDQLGRQFLGALGDGAVSKGGRPLSGNRAGRL